jgi:Glyoxalase/Bleomycin resistance protein/Dioxygenase superfamily
VGEGRSALVQLGRIVQIAYDVGGDVKQAGTRHAARFGSGPFFVREHIELAVVEHRGAPAVFDHSSAYGQSGGVMVELVCQHQVEPESLRRQLAQRGIGIHHVAFFTDDLGREAARLDDLGYPQAMLATTASGRQFAFHDAVAELGHLIEIYELDERLLGFYTMVAEASVGWDGRQPVRTR